MKIFGREPAAWMAVIGPGLTLLAATGVPWFSGGMPAAATAFISAALVAWCTRPPQPALAVGALSAGTALVAEYGVHLSDTTVGALSALVLGVFTLAGVRATADVSPRETALSQASQWPAVRR